MLDGNVQREKQIIMTMRKLQTELNAIQDLLRGKQRTDPERHSGEGIFCTSKVADRLIIKGSDKKLICDIRYLRHRPD